MSFAELNGSRIMSGSVTIPYYGLWTADIALAAAGPLPILCTLTIGNLTLQGAVYRSASFTQSRSARIVGGFGGWRKAVPAQAYYNPRGINLSLPLRDAASLVGEQVQVTNDASIGTSFVREAAPAERLLRQMCGPEWFVDVNGVTQIGVLRPTGRITTPFSPIDWSGGKGRFEIATETYADWLPGRSFTSSNISIAQFVGMTTFQMDNDGKVRLFVLSSGAADIL